MANSKKIRTKGKFSFTNFFQKFKEGDVVALIKDLDFKAGFPGRMHGRTGTAIKSRGRAYVVKVKDFNKAKEYIVMPIHLKRIAQEKHDN